MLYFINKQLIRHIFQIKMLMTKNIELFTPIAQNLILNE